MGIVEVFTHVFVGVDYKIFADKALFIYAFT